jgi:hypothetical protein
MDGRVKPGHDQYLRAKHGRDQYLRLKSGHDDSFSIGPIIHP